MNYRVVVRPKARRSFGRLPAEIRQRIALALDGLEEDPRPPGTRKMSGRPYWRLRVGDYRIVYAISDRERLVLVENIARRTTTTYD